MHRWHREFYIPRIFNFTICAVVTLVLWREGNITAAPALGSAAVFLVWPHLVRVVGPRLAPSRRGAMACVLADGVMGGALAPLLGWPWTLVGPSLINMTMNALGAGGVRFLLWTLATFVGAGFASHLLVGPGASELAGAGVASGALAIAWTMAYGGLIATRLRTTANSLSKRRRELQELRDHLEDKVEERTAALASTNQAISRFVPVEFLHALGHEDVRTVELGNVIARDLTILFTDIRDFTKLSEQMSPEQTFRYLNECLSSLGPHIREHGGFIDKYIGDAIMALFPRSPASAVSAAVAMLEEARDRNQRSPDLPPLSIGIGIHFGGVMMGTVGEAQRFEATVISDAVNLTSRLESLTKQLGCAIVVSREVADHVEDPRLTTNMRSLGAFVVKGRTRPVTLFEVFAWEDEASRALKRRTLDRFAAGLRHHEEGRFSDALAAFTEVLGDCPGDGPARFWMARAREAVDTGATSASGNAVRLLEK